MVGTLQAGRGTRQQSAGDAERCLRRNPAFSGDGGGGFTSTSIDYLRIPDGGAGGTYDWTAGSWSAQVDFVFPLTPDWGDSDHMLLVSKGSFNMGTGWEIQINNAIFNGKYMPAGATTGGVVVTAVDKTSNSVAFTVPPPPSITTLAPTSGPVGTAVTISGANFGTTQGTSTVRFNGTLASTSSWNGTIIMATVPAGATTGNVVVTVGGRASNGVGFTVTAAPPSNLAIDNTVFSDGSGTRTTAAFSTASAGEVLVAFVSADGPTSGGTQTATVTGAGLTWTLVRRSNTQFGTSEIWTATAVNVLSNVTVTSTLGSSGYYQSLTVLTFTGASGVGASSIANAASGAPVISVTATKAGSFVYAVGNDWDNASARTVGGGQTMTHQYLAPVGDTFWVQRLTNPVPAPGAVQPNDTAPTTDRWNFAAVEVVSK